MSLCQQRSHHPLETHEALPSLKVVQYMLLDLVVLDHIVESFYDTAYIMFFSAKAIDSFQSLT